MARKSAFDPARLDNEIDDLLPPPAATPIKAAAVALPPSPAPAAPSTVFGRLAENGANSLHRGDGVVAAGTVTVEGFTRQDGTPGVSNEMTADHLGVALLFATVTVSRSGKTEE